jgi:Polyketide cyclase / dehydrase and lipid transport
LRYNGANRCVSNWNNGLADSFGRKELEKKSPDIHWPVGYTPEQSPIFAHTEIDINAPASTVWKNLILAEHWPHWYFDTTTVHVFGDSDALHQNTRFDWLVAGARTESRVHEYVSASRIGWYSQGQGFSLYHNWLVVPTGQSSCHVINEIAVDANTSVVGSRDQHKLQERWLTGLKSSVRNPVQI